MVKMVILKMKAKTIAPVIAGVIIFSLVAVSISATYSVNAVRYLPDSVSPGDSFNVTVNFTAPADNFNAIGLTEVANETANMTVEGKKEWCTPKADFCKVTDNKIELLWYGPYDADTDFTAVYKVSVPSDAKAGSYAFSGTIEYYIGSDGPYKKSVGGNKEITVGIPAGIVDTGTGTYPSISGTHRGTITPSQNIPVSKLYTYPCTGTGGHTESIELYENGLLIASGTWSGYQADWHNITITPSVTLLKDHGYNYTIRTGSYPQIIHESSREVTGGNINCTSFVDANGKEYTDWIPAIRLE